MTPSIRAQAGKKGLLRRLLSSKSSVASLLKRSSWSAVSLELCTAAGSDGALHPVRSVMLVSL